MIGSQLLLQAGWRPVFSTLAVVRCVTGSSVTRASHLRFFGSTVPKCRSMASVHEKTFMYQDKLPSLPVPPLEQTCRKYLDSVKPLVTDEEYIQTEFVVNEFNCGVGKQLQEKLKKRGKERRNWLAQWWDEEAYLRPRYPIAPLVNIGGPMRTLKVWPPQEGTQVKRAALMTNALLQMWQKLYREELAITKLGPKPLCMYQYTRLFAECRVPGKDLDTVQVNFKPAPASSPHHIVVQMRGRLFKCDVLDENYEPLTAPEIERQFNEVVSQVESKPPGPSVGALTAEDRDIWFHVRERIQSLDANNGKYFEAIEKAIFLVVLDEHEANDYDEIALHSTVGDCRNRWFDKGLNIIVHKSGTLASHCDHTPFDGIVEIEMVGAAWDILAAKDGKWKGREDIGDVPEPVELDFVLDDEILKAIDKAIVKYESVASRINYFECVSSDYGKAFMKTQNIHPDTYCQLAAQLTYYRMHRKPAPTYESAQTRLFYHGRTDTVRSCTSEALEWSKAMLDADADVATKAHLFRKAVDKHNQLMKEAVSGNGIPTPQIFLDKAWKASGGGGSFVLSTSCTGFTETHGGCAPMVHNGYGYFYSITDDAIYYHLSTWKDSKVTDGPRFAKEYIQSMQDMRNVLLQSSKL